MNNLKQTIKSHLVTFAILIAGLLILLIVIFLKTKIFNGGVLGVQYSHPSGVIPVISVEYLSYQKGSNDVVKYTVSLNGNPGEKIKVGVTQTNSDHISFNSSDSRTIELEFDQTNWNSPKEVLVNISDDIKKGKYIISNTLNQEIRIELNVTAPGIIFNPTSSQLNFKEESSISYSVQLTQNPYSEQLVRIDTLEDTSLYLDEGLTSTISDLKFNESNWDIPQFIRIYFGSDITPGFKNVRHTLDSESFFYSINLDYSRPVFDADVSMVSPSDTEFTYNISLSSQPIEDLTITIRSQVDSGVFLNPEHTSREQIVTLDKASWDQKKQVTLYFDSLLSGQTFKIEHESLGRKFFKSIYVDGLFPIITKQEFSINNAKTKEISYSVRLNKQPQNDTVVRIDLKNFQYISLSDESKPESVELNFTDFNWSTFQNVNFILDDTIPYGLYSIEHEVLNYVGSERSVKVNVSGNKLIIDNGKIISTKLDSGYADLKLKLDSNPIDPLNLSLLMLKPGIYFDNELTSDTATFVFDSENWADDNNVRVYFDKNDIQPFEYYDIEASLNGYKEFIRIYPHE